MQISELLAVKIENTILKLQQLQHIAEPIQTEQRNLIETARKEVGASAVATYNVQTHEFDEPHTPKAS